METSCCTPELTRTFYSKYDPERLKIKRTYDMKNADIIIINGHMTKEALEELQKGYEEMEDKPTLIAVGGCSIKGGPLNSLISDLRIDIFIPGCPPRPEAIIYGMLKGLAK